MLWLLRTKYPKRVPEVYRRLIDHPNPDISEQSWQFARAVAEGPLPVLDKVSTLAHAAKQANPDHCAAGVKYLRAFDRKLAHELLIAGLVRLSMSPRWSELTLAELAAEGVNPREWQALARATRRADVGGRLELLKVIAEEPSQANRKTRLAFLMEYLTDDAVRDKESDKERYRSDTLAGSEFNRLEVRNFAAMMLADVTKQDIIWRVDWSAEHWAKYRAKVRAAVMKELER